MAGAARPQRKDDPMNSPHLPAGALCVLVGPPGCGKSTLASCWPESWRVCLDRFRELATDSFSVRSSVLGKS
ncbi:AAA family ATPase [Streptomyces atroolivaceus]|uniref:AAA family ATPase n=1 Tax=Streptomyces atroolivaceus TaxID=66869 RepID=UPI003644A86C